jgi:hypothetical protein
MPSMATVLTQTTVLLSAKSQDFTPCPLYPSLKTFFGFNTSMSMYSTRLTQVDCGVSIRCDWVLELLRLMNSMVAQL